MLGSKSTRRYAAARYQRLFSRASREFDLRMRAIVASQAAKHLLVSGSTIRAAIRASSEVTSDAVREALSGIATATEHAGSKREIMLAELADALATHHVAIEKQAGVALTKVGLSNDVKHAKPHFAVERERHAELIADFREGWTVSAGKRWHERHPLFVVFLSAVIAFAVGWAGKSLLGDQWQRSDVVTSAESIQNVGAADRSSSKP